MKKLKLVNINNDLENKLGAGGGGQGHGKKKNNIIFSVNIGKHLHYQ
jgi:hypothetical protein